MKEQLDIEDFVDKLWSNMGIPDHMQAIVAMGRLGTRRKRLRKLKDIYFNGKARD